MKLDLNKLEELSKKVVIGKLEYDQGMYLRLTPEGKMEYDFYPENVQFIVALHNAFPSILQTIRSYEQAIEKMIEMDVTDCEEEDCQHECGQRNPLWRSKRDTVLSDLDNKLSEI